MKNRCVVRLKTSSWQDKRGVHTKKSMSYLRRQCAGYNILQDDFDNVGASQVIDRIINLNECEDGVYQVVTCNETRDFETGYVDGYDYKLIKWAGEA